MLWVEALWRHNYALGSCLEDTAHLAHRVVFFSEDGFCNIASNEGHARSSIRNLVLEILPWEFHLVNGSKRPLLAEATQGFKSFVLRIEGCLMHWRKQHIVPGRVVLGDGLVDICEVFVARVILEDGVLLAREDSTLVQ